MTDLGIRILEGDGFPPVHTQISNAVEYAIGFGQLRPGTALPSVRKLAADLGVAPNTVSRAYQDLQSAGLVETCVGKGTFVSELVDKRDSAALSRSTLRGILRPAIASARATGFDPDQIVQMVHQMLKGPTTAVGFIGINQCIVEKWSEILEREFRGLGVEVIGIPIAELRRDVDEVVERLNDTCCVFTLLSTWAEVHRLWGSRRQRLSALLSELSTKTHAELATLPSTGTIGVVCRDFYVNSLLSIISGYTDLDRVQRVSPDSEQQLVDLIREANTVVHTLASAEKVAALASPQTKLIELEFIPNRTHLEQVRSRVQTATAAVEGRNR